MPEIEELIYRVEIDLKITWGEVERIRECCAAHYDGACKAAALPEGFVYGWRNHFDWFVDGKEVEPTLGDMSKAAVVRATWSNIDTTCKILEMERYMQGLMRIHPKFRRILSEMAAASDKANGGGL